jgi:membrane-associated phospholipid phosphatase
MEAIWDWGISLTILFQSLGNWLEAPMQFFSFLGQEEFYLIVAPAIYWCLDTRIGVRLALWLVVSANLNSAFKLLFADPRPYWYSTQVKAFAAETSFGLPSGHSQNSVVIFGGMGWLFNRRWILWAGGILTVLVGVSRIYLGVHFVSDVLAGWLIGLVLLWALLKFEPNMLAWIRNQNQVTNTIAAFLVSLILIAIVYIPRLFLSDWTIPQAWLDTIAVTSPESLIAPLESSGAISNAGAFFGLALGALWIAKNPLQTKGVSPWKLAARYVIGVLGVLLFWYGLKLIPIFAGGESLFDLAMRYIRYGLTGFWMTGLAPAVFQKFKI